MCDHFLHKIQNHHLLCFLHSLEIACVLPVLAEGMRGEPQKPSYEIGEKVTLSCPDGMHLEGAALILCEPSLKWSPNMKNIQCKRTGKPLQ